MRPLVKADELVCRYKSMKRDVLLQAGPSRQSLYRSAERVGSDDIEVHRRCPAQHFVQRSKKQRLILDAVQVGHVKQAPRGTELGRRPEDMRIDSERYDDRLDAVLT